MNSPIASVEVFTLTQPRKVPYLGALREGEVVNPNGYIVRKEIARSTRPSTAACWCA